MGTQGHQAHALPTAPLYATSTSSGSCCSVKAYGGGVGPSDATARA